MRKIFIGLIIIVALGIAGVFLFETFQSQNLSNTLSKRSKEFIAKKEENSVSKFSGLLEKEKEDTSGKRYGVGDCFSFTIPYQVFNMREEGPCDYYFAFEDPKGRITAFARNGSYLTFDNLEGVSMRRQDTEKYKEEKLEVNGKTFLIFQNMEEAYQKTAYYYEWDMYIVLTLTVSTSDSQDSELKKILKSLVTSKTSQNMEQ